MRRLAAALLALAACQSSLQGEPQVAVLTPLGLYTAPNEHGELPPGALVQATDVEIKDKVAVQRRGMVQAFAQGGDALWPFQGRLLLHSGSTLFYSDVGLAGLISYPGPIDAPAGKKVRFAPANGNAYIATASGVKRLDVVTGVPVSAGIAPGLDVQGSLSGSSGFLPNDSAVAYRAVWGVRDANGNLILGAPAGRAVIANSSGGTRDVAVSTSIPANLPANAFWQLYRTAPSVSAATDPGDEAGLVYEGPQPSQAAVTQLARSSNVVTATTAAAHGFSIGQIVRVGPGGGTPAHEIAVSASGQPTRSTDGGATWSSAGVSGAPVGLTAAAYAGSQYVAVGSSVAATSPDGLTWTSRTIPAGTYRAVVWTGARWVAIGDDAKCAVSTDGITWTAAGISGLPASGTFNDYKCLAWSGSILVALGTGSVNLATSPDGLTWTQRAIGSGLDFFGATWTGSRFVTISYAATPTAYYSADGITWSAGGALPYANGAYLSIVVGGSTLVAVGYGTSSAVPIAAWSSDGGASWTAGTGLPSSGLFAVAYNGSSFQAVGNSVATRSTDGHAWTTSTIPAGSWAGAATGGGFGFAPGEYVLSGTPTGTTFTYAEAGPNGTLVAAQTATPLTAAILDQIPSTFSGATLYTSQSQEGILASAYEPPSCSDMAEFRGSLFWLNTTDRATLDVYLLASGAPSGLQTGDTVTINGLVFTAGGSESISTRQFQAYTSGTPSQNVANTAASLVRVVNRAQGSPVYCRDLSGVNDAPGHLQLTTRALTDSITIAVSRSSAFALTGGTTAAPDVKPNELRWSPKSKPDSAPITNRQTLGDKNAEGYRVIALRDSVFVLKQDGIWRLYGDNASWTITPFDTTTELVGPDSAVVLDNTIFALTTKGVVQISDTGVTIISGPIRNLIEQYLSGPLLAATKARAVGVAYEQEGRYTLWLPVSADPGAGMTGWVYDHFQSLSTGAPVWTARSDQATAAVLNPADGKLYRATSSALYQERKSLDFTDYSDGETPVTISTASGVSLTLADASAVSEGDAIVQAQSVAVVVSVAGPVVTLDRGWTGTTGAATAHKAIPSVVEFAPFIPTPGAVNRWAEAAFLFRWLAGNSEADFATEFTRAAGVPLFPFALPADFAAGYVTVAFNGQDYGLDEGSPFPVNLRTWVPRDQQMSERLSVRFSHKQAFSPMALEGLSVVFAPTSIRLRR